MSENARDKFSVGTRVVMSEEYQRMYSEKVLARGLGGVVVGFGRKPQFVRVQRDGTKPTSTCSYDMKFWDVEAK